eukprot:CAMPEP_0117652114 /NCGR_PEP_ID=MMETSP0804-20121206/2455_1 /TAXON_ID=1074897 /ORGANISM="Tetraselmis astigmatica, Strain CCMP880" /LENGTH=709 /DNA_ID=CAMNT_0005458141 /DNA_START=460 /DNA_END=2586 /DNA_ORIENTATION=-
MSDSDEEPLAARFNKKSGATAVLVTTEPASVGQKRAAPASTNGHAPSDSDSDEDNVPLAARKMPKSTPSFSVKKEPLRSPLPADSFFNAMPSEAPLKPTPANRPVRQVVKEKDKGPGGVRKKVKDKVKQEVKVKKEVKKAPMGTAPPKKAKAAPQVPSNEIKWTTLQHGGVMFPPEYEPHGVKMRYDGREIELNAEEEEVATMFAVMMETDYYKKETFRKNFWADFQAILEKSGKHKVLQELDKCDFKPIFDYAMSKKEAEKAAKAALTADEKKKIKADKEAVEAPFKTALVDGKQEQVGNFRVEPPGLFRGRGEHPKMGKLKIRVYPRDITINIGNEAPIPPIPDMYHDQEWKEIRHDNTVTWLAFWKDPVNSSQYKYVWLAPNSTFKTDADLQKYEKARMLKTKIAAIRKQYTALAKQASYKEAQMGTAMYFIDKLALRAGHEKDEDEADTVGCCNLKVENVELMENLHIKFDFLGKDSIRYENEVQVEEYIYKNVAKFKKKFGSKLKNQVKQNEDQLFCELDASLLNGFLKDLMPGLSVKVFRTYNASITLDSLLNTDEDIGDIVDKKIAHYNTANKEVAILCNHQRAIPKTHEASMQRMSEKVEKAQAELAELERELKAAKAHKPMFKDDGKEVKPGNPAVVKTKIMRKQEQIKKLSIQVESKEALKTVALGTSKINYLDPRITVAWCKRNEVPIEKVFNRSLFT